MSITKIFGLFVLCALTSYPLSTTAQPVLDVNGVPIENGGSSSYYMVPNIWALGGGVGLEKTGYESCPLSVVQKPGEVSNGLPLKISSRFRSRFVPEGRVKISFADGPKCGPNPPVWTLDYDPLGRFVVKVTDSEHANDHGYFVIRRNSPATSTYKLSFCLPDNTSDCKAIGIVNGERGEKLLGIADQPFEFVLVRADTTSST